jgi:hypothetical protein
VAIQHDDYERTFVGTSDHDVVSAINAAVAVLERQPAPAKCDSRNSASVSSLIENGVGDVHQPLHVGSIYLDAAGNPVNPDEATFDKNSETAGGNLISEEHGNPHADGWFEP